MIISILLELEKRKTIIQRMRVSGEVMLDTEIDTLSTYGNHLCAVKFTKYKGLKIAYMFFP